MSATHMDRGHSLLGQTTSNNVQQLEGWMNDDLWRENKLDDVIVPKNNFVSLILLLRIIKNCGVWRDLNFFQLLTGETCQKKKKKRFESLKRWSV